MAGSVKRPEQTGPAELVRAVTYLRDNVIKYTGSGTAAVRSHMLCYISASDGCPALEKSVTTS